MGVAVRIAISAAIGTFVAEWAAPWPIHWLGVSGSKERVAVKSATAGVFTALLYTVIAKVG